jgi:D-3-phosphoglycerate dehydrogenase
MKVVFLDEVHEILAKRLKVNGYEIIDATEKTKDECIACVQDAFGIVIRSRFPMNAAFLQDAKELRFIARSGAGMENIDLDYTERKGIVCFNAPEGNRNAVAEHALGMLLALFNHLPKADREVRSGLWKREENRGVELEGKTIGIIGFGNNGSAFAKVLRGFNVKVMAYDKYKQNFGNEWVVEVGLEEIMNEADIISLHIPQTEETMFMVDRAFIEKCRKPFYLINLSRGKIVSTNALVDALDSGKIIGACLDVLEYEKSSFENAFNEQNSPSLDFLLNSDQVLLSPHVGGWTKESYFKLSNVLAEKILNYSFDS